MYFRRHVWRGICDLLSVSESDGNAAPTRFGREIQPFTLSPTFGYVRGGQGRRPNPGGPVCPPEDDERRGFVQTRQRHDQGAGAVSPFVISTRKVQVFPPARHERSDTKIPIVCNSAKSFCRSRIVLPSVPLPFRQYEELEKPPELDCFPVRTIFRGKASTVNTIEF